MKTDFYLFFLIIFFSSFSKRFLTDCCCFFFPHIEMCRPPILQPPSISLSVLFMFQILTFEWSISPKEKHWFWIRLNMAKFQVKFIQNSGGKNNFWLSGLFYFFHYYYFTQTQWWKFSAQLYLTACKYRQDLDTFLEWCCFPRRCWRFLFSDPSGLE